MDSAHEANFTTEEHKIELHGICPLLLKYWIFFLEQTLKHLEFDTYVLAEKDRFVTLLFDV